VLQGGGNGVADGEVAVYCPGEVADRADLRRLVPMP
jgi:hypothetical protein